MTPYWSDGQVTLYLGDFREVDAWLSADVMLTDPPYGRDWQRLALPSRSRQGAMRMPAPPLRPAIDGDKDTTLRDEALAGWGGRPAAVFGHLQGSQPEGVRQVLVMRKPPDAGCVGATAGFRRDLEAVYLCGSPWPRDGLGGRSSLLETAARSQGGRAGVPGRSGHPHAKPIDVLQVILEACEPGMVCDPFAGSGSTLVAARNAGRSAVGVEIHEPYAEAAAQRLDQGILFSV